MSADPVERLLGVPGSADARTLLGLPPGPAGAAAVEAALRQRLAALYAHPEGRGEDAEAVRRRLRRAAAALLGSLRRPRPAVPRSAGRHPRAGSPGGPGILTEFDRQVLAVLIGSRGWNAVARSRLVALAATYGVSVQGLRRVVEGLSEYAKSGGPPLDPAAIAGSAGRVESVEHPAATPELDDPGELEWMARIAPELADRSAASTFKLSLLFGLLTVLVGILAGRVLFAPAPVKPPAEPPPGGEQASAAPARPSPPTAAPAAEGARPARTIARFPVRPTFQGRALSAQTTAAADDCPELVDEIRGLARRLTITDRPSEAVYRSWEAALRTIATGWVLVDDATRAQLEEAILECLYAAADAPTVSDRLLSSLQPPGERLSEPADLWRGAWMVGTLADVAASPTLPPAVARRAALQLEAALPDAAGGFTPAADAWLGNAARALVDVTEFAPDAYDRWEFWIAAQRRLGPGPRFQHAVMDAVEAILATSTDLARPGPTADVLGRLLELADFERSAVVRQRLPGILTAGRDRFSGRALWVLTSMLASSGTAPWFGEELVVPEDADWQLRRRLADRVRSGWPEAAAAAEPPPVPPVDRPLAARWSALLDGVAAPDPQAGAAAVARRLVFAARLNEAAARLIAGDLDGAAALLEELEAAGGDAADATGDGGRAPRRPGQDLGEDGAWAVAYERATASTEEKLRLLEELRAAAGTDLGPVDAEVFVEALYTGSPPEVREQARLLAADQFARGPHVAVAMLDQLPDAPAVRSTVLAVSRFTGWLLPRPAAAGAWRTEARLALVEHALTVLGAGDRELDRLAGEVADTYAATRAVLDPGWTGSSAGVPAHEAAAELAAAWRRRAAAGEGAGESAPGRLTALRRRHSTRLSLAEGPLQQFVASQVAVLELMGHAAAVRDPALHDPIAAILEESASQRRAASDALRQALAAERAVGRLWRLRLEGRTTAAGGGRGPSGAPPGRAAESSLPAGALGALPVAALAQPGPSAAADDPDRAARLEALRPAEPLAYFELAEEIADAAGAGPQRELARHLFALAGVLDPARLGRSACLALADLAGDDRSRRRLLALASLLDSRRGGAAALRLGDGGGVDAAAALAVAQAMGHYRRGRGDRALSALETTGATALLEAWGRGVFRGGARRFMEDCRLYRRGRRPPLSAGELVRLLRFEAALLAGPQRSWADELLMTGARPLVEVDPQRLDESLGVDASRPYYRDGAWVASPG